MRAHVRDRFTDAYGRQWTRWDLDPILAIGGLRHGLTLPSLRDRNIRIPVPPPMATLLAPDPDPIMPMPEVQTYDRCDFVCSPIGRPWEVHQFPIYVADGMDRDEGGDWVMLAVWSIWWLLAAHPLRPLIRSRISRRDHELPMRLNISGFFDRMDDRRLRREWMAGRTRAYVWWCGDEVCDCVMPVIERLTPNTKAGFPWVHVERVWEGTFVSRSYGYPDGMDYDTLLAELRQACEEHDIPAPDTDAAP